MVRAVTKAKSQAKSNQQSDAQSVTPDCVGTKKLCRTAAHLPELINPKHASFAVTNGQ
jgi:hypothetical protein